MAMRPIDRVLETILYVDDLDAAERFYGDVLGLELDSRKNGLFVFFRCGGGMLLLFEPEAARAGRNVPAHGASLPGHACFAVAEADLEDWKMRLAAAGVAVEREMEWPRGGRSFYFRDPAGNSLELATPKIWGMPEVGRG
jgi:catechol 2,3-dioxygenase-like lactoylglutathione lyase family enzyme